MAELALSIGIFLAAHALPSTPLRPWLIDRLGRGVFMGVFSLLSTALFAWVWLAYRSADIEAIYWVTGAGIRGISALVVLAAILLLAAAILGRPRVLLTGETALTGADSIRGVLRITRHPLLWSVGLWGLVHMLNNADPPSWLFFGFLTALSFIGTFAIDRRRKRLLGERWMEIQAATSNLPFAAILAGRNRLILSEIGFAPLALGIVLWALLLTVHEPVLGVSPL